MSAQLQFLIVSLLLGGTIGAAPSQGPDPASRSEALLIELFTSQGCYSCPPADALLRDLSNRDELIPLTFHVDYWNHLGWKDPFSSKAWSDRQRAYARLLRSDTVYTPQLVIGGTVDEVGSDRTQILEKIAQALEAGPSRRARKVSLVAGLDVTNHNATFATATATIEPAPSRGSILLVALYERNLTTEIPSGENHNKTLQNDFVVRALETARSSEPVRFAIAPDWKVRDLGVVAFVQDTRSGAILGIDRVREPLGR